MNTNRWNYNSENKDENRSGKDLGKQIQDLVESAVDAFDFSELEANIRSVIDEAKPKVDEFRTKAVNSCREAGEELSGKADSRQYYKKKIQRPRELSAVFKKVPGKFSGPLFFGVGLIGFFACATFGAGLGIKILGGVTSTVFKILLSVFGIFGLSFAILAFCGWRAYKRSVRYLNYQHLWRNCSHITVERLHEETGYPVKQIKKDLHQIMEDKLLPIAYMDTQETCFILTKEAYEQYQAAERVRIQREQEAEQKRREDETLAESVPQGRTILKMKKEAESYKDELEMKKQQIYSNAVKEEINQLIVMIDRIYDCIEDHPEQYSQIYRLNDYYIPTILKLLTTYGEVESQPVQGENITKIKSEIENSLDMINKAMKIMYDELFQDIAMDTSADITVLETMLAREGLTKQQLKAKENPQEIHFM